MSICGSASRVSCSGPTASSAQYAPLSGWRISALVALLWFPLSASAFPGEDLLLDTQLPMVWFLALVLLATACAVGWGIARSKTLAALDAGAAQATDLQAENAKLFRQVQSRVHELMVRDKLLEESKYEAEQLREEHCDFLSISSHRMQKPLETVVSTLNLLARGADSDVRQLAEAALSQCRQLRSNLEELQRAGQLPGQERAPSVLTERTQREMEILLVENDSHPSLRSRLEAFGHKVRRETNGVDGADAALRGKFDLVLIDIRLPLIDGIETARKIRGDFGNNDLLIYGLVSDLRKGDRERYLERGLSGILSLPASDGQILQLLSLVDQKTAQRAPAGQPKRVAKMLNGSTLERQRDTLGHLAFSELLGERLANLPKKVTAFTSALTGRHWLDAQHQAQVIAAEAESVGLEVVASRLKALSARLSIDSERDYCRHQRTEILGLMRTSIQQLKAWREKNVHTEWALG
ncbi:response regulator [Microbulbifer bruguierae]|uniref:Response regulator n=1 Tax=Microbulbifer bruguierae TaxID=3029061 RepID=A0ABY8NCB4_9GAMM|nr:response regulator [Microbulbifer bruguierae]WGL15697.1 response regulator [Microbulbifer bruguierae]